MNYIPIGRELTATNSQSQAQGVAGINPLLPRYGYRPDPFVVDADGRYGRMAALLATVPTEYSGAGSRGGGGGGSGGYTPLPSYGGGSGGGFSFGNGGGGASVAAAQSSYMPAQASATPPQQQLPEPTTPWGLNRKADLKPWTPPNYRR